MGTADVYFSDLRAGFRANLPQRVEKILRLAGIDSRIGQGDLTAVKLHFGEMGNTAFIRPVFARHVVKMLQQQGAKPFLTDTNTLYAGSRSDSVNHLDTAMANGFTYACLGAPLIIADGLVGNSCEEVPVKGSHYDSVAIATDIAMSDAMVSMAHFKCHEVSGIGGSVKNLGMGCSARKGKLSMHSDVSPKVTAKKCTACRQCIGHCAHSAIAIDKKARIDPEACVGCGECIITCPEGAIQVQWNQGPESMQEKMAEYAAGAIEGKRDKCVFVNFITQISPACDCYGHSDAPIVGDIGIAASTDPVALDQACADMVNAAQGNENSALQSGHAPGEDKFRGVYPNVDWTVQLAHAEKIGLGSRDYKLVKLEDKY